MNYKMKIISIHFKIIINFIFNYFLLDIKTMVNTAKKLNY